jgi:hypothetical protein
MSDLLDGKKKELAEARQEVLLIEMTRNKNGCACAFSLTSVLVPDVGSRAEGGRGNGGTKGIDKSK